MPNRIASATIKANSKPTIIEKKVQKIVGENLGSEWFEFMIFDKQMSCKGTSYWSVPYSIIEYYIVFSTHTRWKSFFSKIDLGEKND